MQKGQIDVIQDRVLAMYKIQSGWSPNETIIVQTPEQIARRAALHRGYKYQFAGANHPDAMARAKAMADQIHKEVTVTPITELEIDAISGLRAAVETKSKGEIFAYEYNPGSYFRITILRYNKNTVTLHVGTYKLTVKYQGVRDSLGNLQSVPYDYYAPLVEEKVMAPHGVIEAEVIKWIRRLQNVIVYNPSKSIQMGLSMWSLVEYANGGVISDGTRFILADGKGYKFVSTKEEATIFVDNRVAGYYLRIIQE